MRQVHGGEVYPRVEFKKFTVASHLNVSDDDATDQNVTTDAYVEKYSAVITPTAWMALYGKKAILVAAYIIKTDPGAGDVGVKTLVGGADAVETTGLTIGSGAQLHIHTDIAAFGSDLTVSLEAKNSNAAQTSVIDYCNIDLHIGTKATSETECAKITGLKSAFVAITQLGFKVWTGATDAANIIVADETGWNLVNKSSSTTTLYAYAEQQLLLGPINSYLSFIMKTALATNPALLESLSYNRAYH